MEAVAGGAGRREPSRLEPRWGGEAFPCGLGLFVATSVGLAGAAVAGRVDWLAPAVAVGATTATAALLSRPAFRTAPPFGWRTVGDLAKRAVYHREFTAERDDGAAAVFEELRAILVRHFGLKPEEITPSARFVEDLRLD